MEAITVSVGEAIRVRDARPNETPTAVLAFAQSGQATLVLRTGDNDSEHEMRRLAKREGLAQQAREKNENRLARRKRRRYA